MREQRKKIWIDGFQTHLVLRIALYFGLYQISVWGWILIERQCSANLEAALGPAGGNVLTLFGLLGGLVLGLVFIHDAAGFAHRIVGPLYRFRKTMQAIANGEEVALVRLREGDYLLELRDECNEMLKALEQRGAIVLQSTEAKQDKGQPVSA